MTGSERARRALLWTLALNAAFLVVEAVAGFMTNSLALLSDAAHMANDVAVLGLALGAAWLARRPASARASFGYGRAEVVGALVSGVALLAAGAYVLIEAIARLGDDAIRAIPAWPVLVVGVIGLAINLASAWHIHRAGSASLNMRGAFLHMLADAGGSVAVIVAALFALAGFHAADAAVSMLVAVLVLWASHSLIRDATRVLFEFAASHVDPEAIRARLLSLDGIRGIHDLHVWSLDGQNTLFSAHLEVSLPDHSVATRIADLLRREFAIEHTTVQLEPLGAACTHAACPLAVSGP